MDIGELYDRCVVLTKMAEQLSAMEATEAEAVNRYLHETLVLCCAEGLRDTGQAYGNLFSQVDYLCKRHGIRMADRLALQTARKHSNAAERLSQEDLLYDVRAISILISAVFSISVPDRLVRLIPTEGRALEYQQGEQRPYIRCIVTHCDSRYIYATTADGDLMIDCGESDAAHGYLLKVVREGMQLNLLDNHEERHQSVHPENMYQSANPEEKHQSVHPENKHQSANPEDKYHSANPEAEPITCHPRLIIVEPDFLVDISSIATCFTEYGHHPLLYTLNRLGERANSQPILLGNFAGQALDDIINQHHDFANSLSESFRQQALQFCTCEGFSPQSFTEDARCQTANLEEVVTQLFGTYDREKAILEPSFVCERLGLQGRVDLMTTDMRLLVEQKSGKNMNIERMRNNGGMPVSGHLHREDHYVQLLLYYGILRYNFGVSDQKADIRLLYSRYPAKEGLLVVNFYQQLFREALKFRNQLVATEYHIAQKGFGTILPHLNVKTIYSEARRDSFFTRYVEPKAMAITTFLARLPELERAYFTRMMDFVYREQLYAKVGSQEGKTTAIADLWNMPLSEKKEMGNIYTDLKLTDRRKSSPFSGYDLLTLEVPDQGEDFLPNFRRGDMICLYAYNQEPDITKSIIYKGTIQEITTCRLVVRLSDGQQNPDIFRLVRGQKPCERYAIEHGTTEMSTGSHIRSLQTFISGPAAIRALLLGQREPEADTSVGLSRSYHPDYDEVLLKAAQAKDYFLLVGPPGTGKTSMALHFLVEEYLKTAGAGRTDAAYQVTGNQTDASLLLASYTNRAVDEICGMLEEAGFDYLRLSHVDACDPRYRHRLLDAMLDDRPKLAVIRQRIQQVPIIVSTTSMLQARPYMFQLKRFGLAIIDEASQILEPNLVGLLSKVEKFILIGDYKQLPAVVQQPECESVVEEPCLRAIALTDCRQSLFERLIRWEEQCGRSQFMGVLRKQGRMHPDIAAFPNQMFYFREQLQPVPLSHQLDISLGYDQTSEDALDDRLKQHRMIFMDSGQATLPEHADTSGNGRDSATFSDKVNPVEAHIVADLLRRIHRFYGDRFNAQKTVGVIVPYRNQIAMIRREVERLGIPELAAISIDTVERYQGSQRDVIIYSFTIRHGYQLDFLTGNSFEEEGHQIDRRLNVAITRARKQMILTGVEKVLRENALFGQLIDFCH